MRWNFQRIMDPEEKAFDAPFYSMVETVEALDGHTVKFTLKHPSVTLLPVMGAAGGLGSCLVQVARTYGAQVIAGAGTDTRLQAALSLGAQFGINYRRQDLDEEVIRLVGARCGCSSTRVIRL